MANHEVPYERELRVARALMRHVGKEILYPNYGKAHGIIRKDNGTLRCEEDLLASDFLTEGLQRHFPTDGLLEEERQIDQRSTYIRCWTVDPLDSSVHFAEGSGTDYSVLVSLLVGYTPVLGAAYLPHDDIMLTAMQGCGAFQEIQHHDPKPLQVNPDPNLPLVCSKRRHHERLERILQIMNVIHRPISGSAKFLEVALGRARGAIHPQENTTYFHDIAPLQIITTESGGIFTAADGSAIDYRAPSTMHTTGLAVASTAEFHQALVAAHHEVYKK